jgi:hypothetical protein
MRTVLGVLVTVPMIWTGAAFGQSLPSCDRIIEDCVANCYSRGAVNECPKNCRRKIMQSPNGERGVLWGEFANNGVGPHRNPESSHRIRRCH